MTRWPSTGNTIFLTSSGKTKLRPLLKNNPRNQVMVGEGIDFGKVDIDSLIAKAVIKPGSGSSPSTLDVTQFETKSKDGELHVDYHMTFAEVFDESIVDGCLRFKGTDYLLKREPKTFAAMRLTSRLTVVRTRTARPELHRRRSPAIRCVDASPTATASNWQATTHRPW